MAATAALSEEGQCTSTCSVTSTSCATEWETHDESEECKLEPEQQQDQSFAEGLCITPCIVEERRSGRRVLVATVEASNQTWKTRQGVDLAAVIDTSGSMDGRNLDLVKQSLKFVIQQMHAGDRLSIVSFANESQVILPLTEMNSKGKELAQHQIDSLNASGGTNLSAGVFSALHQLEDRKEPRAVTSMLLLTDGLSNRGILDSSKVLAGVKAYMGRMQVALSLFTFGLGTTHDPMDLVSLASASEGGVYTFLQNAEEIPGRFEKCLGGLFSIAAQNLTLTYDAKYLELLSVTKKKIPTGDFDESKTTMREISLEDIYCDERKDVVFMLKEGGSTEAIHLRLNYFDVHTLVPKTVQCMVPHKSCSDQDKMLQALSSYNRILAVRAINHVTKHGLNDKTRIVLARCLARIKASGAYRKSDPISVKVVSQLEALLHAGAFAGPSMDEDGDSSLTLHMFLSLSNQYQSQRFVSVSHDNNSSNKVDTIDAFVTTRRDVAGDKIQITPQLPTSSSSFTLGSDVNVARLAFGSSLSDCTGSLRTTQSDSHLDRRMSSLSSSSSLEFARIYHSASDVTESCPPSASALLLASETSSRRKRRTFLSSLFSKFATPTS